MRRIIAYTIVQLSNHRAFAPDVIRYDTMTGRCVVLYGAPKVVSPAANLEAQISGDGKHAH